MEDRRNRDARKFFPMMNGLYNEDCRETLKRELLYDYVITSPPDLNELGYEKIDASSI